MDLLAVRTARLIAHLNAEELNPSGRPLAHDFMRAFIERYSFIKTPTTAAEILDTENKGLTFEQGKLGDVGINKVVLFDWGVVVETSASTDASEIILQDMLNWGAETFGMSNRPSLVTRRNFVSEIVFSSEINLNAMNPTIQRITDSITEMVASYLGHSEPFETYGFSLAFDSSRSKQLYTPFQIYHLPDTPFSEKKYYCGAPLSTADHIKVIEQLEEALKN